MPSARARHCRVMEFSRRSRWKPARESESAGCCDEINLTNIPQMRQILPVEFGTLGKELRWPDMTDNKQEQALARTAALKGISSGLSRELPPEAQIPDRFRELLAQIEASEAFTR
jgi:hypothetical protein